MDDRKKCGFETKSGRFTWVCVAPVHAKIYQSKKGSIIYDRNPKADQHLFVRKYPGTDR